MPGVYDQLISRVDVAGLMPEPAVIELNQELARSSIALSLFRQVPMSTGQAKMSVLDGLPYAYWVNGDTGLKQTTKVSWAGKYLVAEEMAVIVPVPEAVVADMGRDIWGLVRPLLVGAFSEKLDHATVFGIDRPATFAQAIVPGSAANGTAFTGPGLDAVNDALDALEGADVTITNIVGRATLRGVIRRALAELGGAAELGAAPNSIFGYPLTYPGGTLAWPAGLQAILGNFNAAIVGVRQDINYRVLTESVISDDAGNVVFNFAQQDAVGLRATARYAFAVADQQFVDADGSIGTTYPFATATEGP